MNDDSNAEATERVESSIPNWQNFMTPLLQVLEDGKLWARKEATLATLDEAGITAAQREEHLPSGNPRALNRVGWAASDLVRAGAIDRPARGVLQITELGRELLVKYPNGVFERDLKEIPMYQAYVPKPAKSDKSSTLSVLQATDTDADPIELIEAGISAFESDAASELIRKLREKHPDFFEQAVVDVLNKMGYGGSEERGRRLGGSGDGGVDGVIDQDALGLSRIYVQAKRYGEGNTVQRPEIQGFVGALAGKGATQGVFVTTSTFSKGAFDYVEQIPSRVVLIDGPRLAELMIRYRVGVQIRQTYEVVEVDEDYFE